MTIDWGLLIIVVLVSLVLALILSFLSFLIKQFLNKRRTMKEWKNQKGVMSFKNPDEIPTLIDIKLPVEVPKEKTISKFRKMFEKKEIPKNNDKEMFDLANIELNKLKSEYEKGNLSYNELKRQFEYYQNQPYYLRMRGNNGK